MLPILKPESIMEKNNIQIAVGILLVCLMASTANAQMVHPGGWHTQADLDEIRDNVAAGREPWITGWNAARDEGPGVNHRENPDVLITNNGSMHRAGFAAWILTMKWVASGDRAFADAAIDAINVWVRTVRDFDVFAPTLTVSTGAGAMAQAAEILAHGFNGEAGWRQADIEAAQRWFRTVIYDQQTNTGIASSSNFGTSALGGNISMAIFMDDQDVYNFQRQAFITGYNLVDGCNSLTDYIPFATGQAFETGRDQSHVQGGIAHLTEAALSLWNQGDEFVYLENNRLLAGVEYHARYNLGFNDLPYNRNIPNRCNISVPGLNSTAISTEDRGDFSPVYYMSAKLFSKAGLDAPNTEAVLRSPGYSPEITNFAHPGLGTFTFVPTDEDNNGNNGGNNNGGNSGNPGDTTVVHMTKRNAQGFAIDGNNGAANFQAIYLWQENSRNRNQRWIEINRGDGFYSYQKEGTNHCIDGNNGGANRQEVYLFTCGANNQNQHWQKIPSSVGTFRLQTRNSPSFSLDGNNGGANAQAIYLFQSNSNNQNQQWFITPQ